MTVSNSKRAADPPCFSFSVPINFEAVFILRCLQDISLQIAKAKMNKPSTTITPANAVTFVGSLVAAEVSAEVALAPPMTWVAESGATEEETPA